MNYESLCVLWLGAFAYPIFFFVTGPIYCKGVGSFQNLTLKSFHSERIFKILKRRVCFIWAYVQRTVLKYLNSFVQPSSPKREGMGSTWKTARRHGQRTHELTDKKNLERTVCPKTFGVWCHSKIEEFVCMVSSTHMESITCEAGQDEKVNVLKENLDQFMGNRTIAVH